MLEQSKPNAEPSQYEQFVRDLFMGFLRREADPDGLRHFVQGLENGRSFADVTREFATCEEAKLSAQLFVPPGHFYSPIVDPAEAVQHMDAVAARGVPESLPDVALDRKKMIQLWRKLLPFLNDATFPEKAAPGFRYHFENPAYSYGDGLMLQAMLRHLKPKRVVEIGSGWSSACAIDTAERHLAQGVEFTFIDPYSNLLRELLGKTDIKYNIIETRVQDVPLDVFGDLKKNDILFIDSTHVMRTGSDVCFEIFEILPRLAAGVVVHIHDMFWPFEYPVDWVVTQNRSWNELYAIRAFLANNDTWQIKMFSNYLTQTSRELVADTCPKFLRNPGGAIWLTKVK